MNIRHSFLAVSALALLGTAAQAESYQGVQSVSGALSRDAVRAEALRAAAAPDQNVVRGSRGPETVAVSQPRDLVRAEAVRSAAAPDQNVVPGSRVDSRVLPTLSRSAAPRAEAGAPGTQRGG